MNKGGYFFNHFYGYMHSTRPTLLPSRELSEKVDFIWNHIKQILCAGNQTAYEYLKKWLCHTVSGRKMKTAIYLKSIEGTGKSIITDFFKNHVFGEKIVHYTSDASCITGQFNQELLGKVFLILEELPTDTQGQWASLANSLKAPITQDVLNIKEKYKNSISIRNNLSIIISTNNDAIKISSTDRRFFVPDISLERVGDHEYFNYLGMITDDRDVGEAFYWNCIDHANATKTFSEKVLPTTGAKKDQILEHLGSVYEFIKQKFVLKHREMDMKFSKFYQLYEAFCDNNKLKPQQPISTAKLMRNIGIETLKKTNNITWVYASCKKLVKYYKNKNWIHDLDDYDEPEDEFNDDDDFGLFTNEDEVDYHSDGNDYPCRYDNSSEVHSDTDYSDITETREYEKDKKTIIKKRK